MTPYLRSFLREAPTLSYSPSPRTQSRLVVVILAASFLSAAVPLAGAAEGDLLFCGFVKNRAGWAIPQASVRFDRATPTSSAPSGYAPVKADGSFAITLPGGSYYHVTVSVNGTASDGGVYAPWSSLAYAPAKPAFLPVEGEAASCGGAPGVQLNAVAPTASSRSFVTGGIVVLDAVGQGFVEVHLIDQTVVPNVDVGGKITLLGTLRDARQQPFPVGAGTGLRFVCSADTGAGSILVKADSNFMVTATTRITCAPPATLFTTPVQNIKLWRQPVEVAVLVGDASTRTLVGPKAVESPLSEAAVFVQKTVAGFVDLRQAANCGSALTHSPTGAPLDIPVGVTGTGASPYHCATETDSSGVATLLLPWIDDSATPAHAFQLGVNAGTAYNRSSIDVLTPRSFVLVNQNDSTTSGIVASNQRVYNPASDSTAMTSVAAGGVVKHVSLIYRNKANPVDDLTTTSHRVTDIYGNPVANAAVQIIGDVSTATQREYRTDADGWFTAKVSPGAFYSLHIMAAGFNTRSCSGADDTLVPSDPANCYKLIQWDHAAISGVVTDAPTGKPIANVQLCAGCPSTGADGSFSLEITPGTDLPVGTGAEGWVVTAPNTAERDNFGTFNGALARAPITWTIEALHAGQPIENALVCIAPPAGLPVGQEVGFQTASPCATVTAADGKLVLTGMSWHKRSGTGESYDVGPSTVTISKHSSATDQYKASTMQVTALSAPASQTFSLSLDPESTLQTIVRIVDGNLPTMTTTATATPTLDDPGDIVCGKECAAAVLDAQTGHSFELYAYSPAKTYSIAGSDAAAGYRDATSVAGIAPGTQQTLKAFRELKTIRIFLRDAHTGGAVEGANVQFVGTEPGFVCAPADDPGAPVCAGVTSATGAVTLNVPWSNACFASSVSPTTYRVHVPHDGNANSTSGNQNVETVAMQAATYCLDVPVDADAIDVYLFAARAPSALAGTLATPTGSALSATIKPLSERSSSVFLCNPERSNSPTAFPDCDGKAVAGGAFSLGLPSHGTTQGSAWPDGSWNLTFESAGHYPEWRTLVKQTDAPVVTLWPMTFTATVTITEAVVGSGPIPCGQGYVGAITVSMRGVEKSAEQVPPTTANAVRGQTCTATLLNVPWLRAAAATPQDRSSPDETDHYEITVAFGSRTFTASAELGPKVASAQVDVLRQPTVAGAFAINGRVVDVDALAPAMGLVGGIRVTAVRQTAECFGSGNSFSTTTDSTGNFVLPVGCAGTYAVTISYPTTGLYQAASEKLVTVTNAEPSPTTEPFSIIRARVSVAVDVRHLNDPMVPVAGTVIHLLGVDITTKFETSDHATTRTSTIVTFANVPWGVYRVHVVPASSGIRGVDEAIVVPPTAMPAPFVAFTHNAPPAGPNMVIGGNVVDLDAFWGVSFAGGLVVNAVSTTDPACAASAPVLADGSFELIVPCAGDYAVSIGHSALFEDQEARVATSGDVVTFELEHKAWGPRSVLVDGQRVPGFVFPDYSS